MAQQPPEIAQIEAAEAETATARIDEAGQEAPISEEPLDPSRVNALGKAVSQVTESLSNGQVTLEVPEVAEPLEQLPPPVYGPLVIVSKAFGAAAEQGVPEAEPYSFDPAEFAGSNDGLRNGTVLLTKASKDAALKKAVTKPQEQEEAPAEQPPPKEAGPSDEQISALV